MTNEKDKTLGIVGGGQLGRMMVPEAHRLGYIVRIIDPTENAPAAQLGAEQIVASLTDADATFQLASLSRWLTVEIEHVNTEVLAELRAAGGVEVNPHPETLDIIRDKHGQKAYLRSKEIPVADFMLVEENNTTMLEEISRVFGYPYLLKSRYGAYDGRGNMIIRGEHDYNSALVKFAGKELYAERYVPFKKELAVVAARSKSGDIVLYEVVQTIHINNICHTVIAPAQIDAKIRDKVNDVAYSVMQVMHGAGVFGIELFLTYKGEIIVNEIAPRVHNSGHITMVSSRTSQFEQHVRAVTGMDLETPDMIVPYAVMINILGDRIGSAEPRGIELAEKIPGVSVTLYGKDETKYERKMGHVNVIADTPEEAMKKARRARRRITI